MVGATAPARAVWQRNIEADFGGFNGGARAFFSVCVSRRVWQRHGDAATSRHFSVGTGLPCDRTIGLAAGRGARITTSDIPSEPTVTCVMSVLLLAVEADS